MAEHVGVGTPGVFRRVGQDGQGRGVAAAVDMLRKGENVWRLPQRVEQDGAKRVAEDVELSSDGVTSGPRFSASGRPTHINPDHTPDVNYLLEPAGNAVWAAD
jgi:hypothetical protein